ncbi:hypothetical protein EUTSA_v10015358mg [Eutrema salsugineum]|uniref:DNA-directed RNA polymerase subunit n=2 Tax=Eutrema salsugineum TaxID=72664 RepID=V4LH88_EUTSA|nr:hypothetical protein EUTSA_v10015358mg [Eutrema salsugineum]
MFSEVEMVRDVTICAKHLKGQSPPHHQILNRLLQDLIYEKACKEHGFYLGITALESIGNSKNNNDDNHQAELLTFPVSFTCRTFLPSRGDILQGVVRKVLWSGGARGVLIHCGPLRYAYLSRMKMPDYHFVQPETESEEEETPYFQRDDLTKISVGVIVRFAVLCHRFKEYSDKRRLDVYVLASVEGDDTLGPISLAGSERPCM